MALSSVHLLIPLAGAVVSGICAVLIWLHDPRHPANRAATLLVGGAAWWSLCQVFWTAPTPAAEAAVWHRLACLGWAFIGPLALQMVLSLVRQPPALLVRGLPVLYGIAAGNALVRVASPWMHADPVPGPYGWWFEPLPWFRFHIAFTYACVLPTAVVAFRAVRTAPSPAERAQLLVIAAGIAAPMVLASATGALLPILGVPSPPLGAASFGLLGIAVTWSYYRYGFSALLPGSFSREILTTLAAGVGLVGLDGRLRTGNDSLARMLGVPADDLPGLRIDRHVDAALLEPENRRAVEAELARAHGQRIPVAVSTSLLHDKKGLAVGVVLVLDDLREVVGLRRRLVTSGRLAAVGELAAGIAHEINNPMAFVRTNLTQLRAAWDELAKLLPPEAAAPAHALHAEMVELLDDSIEGVERTASIVRDVRSFAHGGSGEREAVDLNDLLEQVMRMTEPQLRHAARLVRSFQEVPRVWGAPQELKQVFVNLVVNAGQALDGRGTVEVTTRRVGRRVEVAVRDDGCGIAPEDRERIFDPFFTTKPVGEGTGLGLAISYQILQAHDAEIAVESEVGWGTTFTVRLPIADA